MVLRACMQENRSTRPSSRPRVLAATLTAATALLGLSACGSGEDPAASADRVVLVTHESFNLPDALVEEFETDTGLDLVVKSAGDAGTVATKVALTADNPTGDAVFGIDNTFASRVLGAGAIATFKGTRPAGSEVYDLPTGADKLVPVDSSNVCVNIDTAWFAEHDVPAPVTLDDLTEPAYRDLFVLPAPSTSSPGMAFLLATVAHSGDDWPEYWTELLANGAKVVDGWSDAYYTDFTAGGEKGTRPIVVSYDSSPAFTLSEDKKSSTTAALLDTCFEQVEYAGVLSGADNADGAAQLVEFLGSPEVQAALPESMYVFPAAPGTTLPADWAAFNPRPTDPFQLDPAEVAENRDAWLTEWTDVSTR